MGLVKPGQELNNQMKIMARYQLIQEGLAKANGDLERTGGGAANQWRQFTGQLTNISTTIGQFVLPAFTAILRVVNWVFSSIVRSSRCHAPAMAAAHRSVGRAGQQDQ